MTSGRSTRCWRWPRPSASPRAPPHPRPRCRARAPASPRSRCPRRSSRRPPPPEPRRSRKCEAAGGPVARPPLLLRSCCRLVRGQAVGALGERLRALPDQLQAPVREDLVLVDVAPAGLTIRRRREHVQVLLILAQGLIG